MAQLVFDAAADRQFEQGVSEVVLFAKDNTGAYQTGVAWNGITNITKSPTGGEATPFYADNMKYANLLSKEQVEGSIEAYTYPEEFEPCNGAASIGTGAIIGEQARLGFAVAYKTQIGNADNPEAGFKLHIIYNMLASPTEHSAATINESPELATMNWGFTTTPMAVTGKKPTATLVLDSTKVDGAKMTQILDLIYGAVAGDPTLQTPDEIAAILAAA